MMIVTVEGLIVSELSAEAEVITSVVFAKFTSEYHAKSSTFVLL